MIVNSEIQAQPNRRLTIEEILDELISDKIIERQNADHLLQKITAKERNERHALEIIADAKLNNIKYHKKIISLEELTFWLSNKVGIDYLRIDPLKINVNNIGDLVSTAYAAKNRILPIELTQELVIFAISEPYLTDWIEEIRPVIKREIKRVLANPSDIERYRKEFFGVSKSVKKANNEHDDAYWRELHNLEALFELGKSVKTLDANDSHIINIVDWLLQYSFDQRASDIHIEPRREVGNIRFRIDGVMHQVYQIPAKVMTAVISRFKILGRMDVAEKRRPQDGRVKTRAENGLELDMRLATMPTAFGEKLVIRIFNPEVLIKDFATLGFSKNDEQNWKKIVSQPHGIILVTGPTGSGKTTTLYATLKSLASPQINVCTVEDPIEMVESSFNQMQVQHNIGLDFAAGIRALMRQDPDIIMVGEIRDRETAEMAIQASLTGHLVLSSLHTNDAPSAITRLLDIGVPHYLIKTTVNGIVAQRLVRLLCTHCRKTIPVDVNLWSLLTNAWNVSVPTHINVPQGCLECRNTGYHGRTGIYEILVLDQELRNVINPNFEESQLRNLAYRKGLNPLRISGALKVLAGVTTIEEIFNVAPIQND